MIAETLPDWGSIYSYEEYAETIVAIGSRNFGMETDKLNPKMRGTLVPIADLANHRNPPHGDWSYEADGELGNGLYIIALEHVAKGE